MNHRAFPAQPPARSVGDGSDRRGRAVLIAGPSDQMTPVAFGSALLQRLHIVLLDHGDSGDFGPSTVVGELPRIKAPLPLEGAAGEWLRHSRRLQGEILCDASGRLYERIGQSVHPVHQLVAGPHGEVLDLAPPAPRRALRPTGNRSPVTALDVEAEGSSAIVDEPLPAQAVPPWRELVSAMPATRIVRFGEFKDVIGPQLLHPERLRDTHRIPCRVHLYEATRAQRIETIAADLFKGGGGRLLPFTETLALRLELTGLVPRRRGAVADHEAGIVLPGERLLRLTVVDDPTGGMPASPRPVESSTAPPPSAGAAAATQCAPATAAKTAIPERFVAPWQFTVSRDEAVYDLNAVRAHPRVRALLDRLRAATNQGRAVRKWEILLAGKSLDDQLWGVRPPRNALCDRTMRAWASRTLAAAGYEPETMLLEWEIFWRRRGL